MNAAVPLATSPVVLRPLREGDLAFVVSTWVQTLAVQPWAGSRAAYLSAMRRSALHMARAARVLVLASSEHDATILGWVCGDVGVVHHAYFRPELLRNGAGRAWVDNAIREVAIG